MHIRQHRLAQTHEDIADDALFGKGVGHSLTGFHIGEHRAPRIPANVGEHQALAGLPAKFAGPPGFGIVRIKGRKAWLFAIEDLAFVFQRRQSGNVYLTIFVSHQLGVALLYFKIVFDGFEVHRRRPPIVRIALQARDLVGSEFNQAEFADTAHATLFIEPMLIEDHCDLIVGDDRAITISAIDVFGQRRRSERK